MRNSYVTLARHVNAGAIGVGRAVAAAQGWDATFLRAHRVAGAAGPPRPTVVWSKCCYISGLRTPCRHAEPPVEARTASVRDARAS